MPSQKIKKDLNEGWYFVTFTVLRWYYIFDRHNRWQIIADSLNYCINNKHLTLYSFVFMLNHIHLIFSSPDVAGFVRDFKRFTAKELKRSMESTEPHILTLFLSDDGVYQFWQKTNMPLKIETENFLIQKMKYIQENPVRKGYVEKPEYWFWSSMNPKCEIKVSPVV